MGNVETASANSGKGKGREIDLHAAPQPVAPPFPGAVPAVERKRVIKAKKAAITMVSFSLLVSRSERFCWSFHVLPLVWLINRLLLLLNDSRHFSQTLLHNSFVSASKPADVPEWHIT